MADILSLTEEEMKRRVGFWQNSYLTFNSQLLCCESVLRRR